MKKCAGGLEGVWDVSSDKMVEWTFDGVTREKLKKKGMTWIKQAKYKTFSDDCMKNFAYMAMKKQLGICVNGGVDGWAVPSDKKVALTYDGLTKEELWAKGKNWYRNN